MATPTTPALTASDVLPKTPEESSVPPASDAVSDVDATIPDEVLEIPAMYGLLRGAPAAISVPVGFQSPETALIGKHAQDLVNAGMGFYESEDKSTRVMFNEAYVNAKQLADADQAGTLAQIVVPLDAVNSEVTGAEAGASGGASLAPVASAAGTPPPASVQRKLATKRVNNLQPGSPTSGPAPGAGRILNNVLKQTV